MTKYIVMLPYSWGSGNSISEAEKVAKKEANYGRKAVKKIAFKYDTEKTETCYIDDMGCVCWKGEQPERLAL
jgi:hypothetical protein